MINTEEKVSVWEGIKSISFMAVLLCTVSFFMGRICLFDTFYCVGIAYVGTIFYSKEARRWSTLLALLGLLSTGGFNANMVKYLLVLLLIAGLRYGMNLLGYAYNLKNQMVIVGVSLLLIGCLSSLFEGMTIYKGIVCSLEVVSTLGVMSVFYIAVRVLKGKKATLLNEYEGASIAFLIACIICGIIDFYVGVPYFGRVYFRDVVIFVVLMGSICLGGMRQGMMIGTIVSSVLVIIGYIPASFVPIYVFTALIGGLFSQLEKLGVLFASTLGILMSFALFNDKVIDKPIMGAFIGAVVISLFIPKNYFGLVSWYQQEEKEGVNNHFHDVQTILAERLAHFSNAFGSLAKQFDQLPSQHYGLEVSRMNELIVSTGETLCKDCTMKQFCWHDYISETYQSGYKMLRVIDKKGSMTEGDIPAEFKKACINAESFAYTLGFMLDVFKNDCKWHESFNESRKLMAQQFDGIAESMAHLGSHLKDDLCFDKEEEDKIKKALSEQGIGLGEIMVLCTEAERREIHLTCGQHGKFDDQEAIQQVIENAIDRKLEIKKYDDHRERKYCYFEFITKKRYRVMTSVQYSAKEKVSGDVYSFLELENGNYLVGLADGMGSGQEARNQSKMAIELLEKFLEAGFTSEVAVRIVNSALVLKSDKECSTTIDMTVIDQYTGIAEFLKAGASVSFLMRGKDVTTVRASSLPIGILSQVDIVSCKKHLKDGDILIMVTDGMLEDRGEISDRETTFKHFILEAGSKSPEYLAKFLMEKVKTLLAGKQNDDMMIMVSRIWEIE